MAFPLEENRKSKTRGAFPRQGSKSPMAKSRLPAPSLKYKRSPQTLPEKVPQTHQGARARVTVFWGCHLLCPTHRKPLHTWKPLETMKCAHLCKPVSWRQDVGSHIPTVTEATTTPQSVRSHLGQWHQSAVQFTRTRHGRVPVQRRVCHSPARDRKSTIAAGSCQGMAGCRGLGLLRLALLLRGACSAQLGFLNGPRLIPASFLLQVWLRSRSFT